MERIYRIITTYLLITIFAACSEPGVTDTETPEQQKSYLTIRNNSLADIYFVKWMDGTATFKYFGYDQIANSTGSLATGIAKGHSSSREIEPGSSKLYFWYTLLGTDYKKRTVEYITVGSGESKVFIFDNETLFENY